MRITSNKQVEELLASAMERCAPDIWEQLCAAPTPADAEAPPGRPAASRRFALRRAVACACACAALCLCVGAATFFRAAAVIGIDVNPSLEIRVNRYDRVLAVEARNDDARAILGEMDLKYLELDTAINALVGSMVRQGYLMEDGAVLVSVTGGSDKRNIRLQQAVVADIETSLQAAGGSGAVYTEVPPTEAEPPAVGPPQQGARGQNQPAAPAAKPESPVQGGDGADRAQQNGVSQAKQRIIDRIRRQVPALGEGDLAALSVEDLIELADEYDVDLEGLIQKQDDDDDEEDDELEKPEQAGRQPEEQEDDGEEEDDD